MRTCLVRAAIVMALVPAVASAQSLSLTESEALARLSPDSPRVRAIRAGIDVARADVLAAGRWPNPRLTFDRESVAGITEYLTMVAQPLPITGRRDLEVQAASASPRPAPAAPTTRCGVCARICGSPSRTLVAAQTRERELTAARDRLRELADVLAQREAAGDAAGFDRLRAEREVLDVEADLTVAASERARAQAILAGFFTGVADPSQIVAAAGSPSARRSCLRSTRCSTQAESTRGELLRLRQDVDAARLRGCARPTAAGFPSRRSSPARSRRRSPAATSAACVTVHAVDSAVRSRAARTRARRGARQRRPRRGPSRFRLALRGEIAALRAAVVERRAAADALSRRGARERRRKSSASRRSATTPASAASSSCSMPTALGASARMRQAVARSRRAAGGNRARIRERMGDSHETHDRRALCERCVLSRRAQSAADVRTHGIRRGERAADARRDGLDRQDRAVHGVSAARRRTDGALRRAPDAARRLHGGERRPGARSSSRPNPAARRRRSPARRRRGRARSASKGTRPRRAAIAGRSCSTRRRSRTATISAPITVFADERAAIADADEAAAPDDPAAIAYLKEQQWTNAFATAPVQEAELRTSDPRAGDDRPAARRRGDRGGAGAGPVHCRRAAVDRRSRHGRARLLGRLEPRLAAATDRATLAADVAEAQAALDGARAEQARAERLLAERAVPARRVEDARRAIGVAEARLRAAEARLAQRDETLRSRRRRGRGQRVRPARADRRPRRRGQRHARRVVRRRRAALPDRPDRSRRAATRRCRRPTPPAARQLTDVALEIPGRPDPLPLESAPRARRRRHRSDDARAAAAVRGRQPRRAAADRPDRHRRPLHARASSACPPCPKRPC